MADFPAFDDPGPLPPAPPSRLRRAFTIAIVLLLVTSMVFLAWISGRREAIVPPTATPTAAPSITVDTRLAIVDAEGRLVTTDASGGSVATYGRAGIRYAFPAWSPDGSRVAALGTDADGSAIHVFASGAPGAAAAANDPVEVYRAADRPPFYLYWASDGRRLTFLTTEPEPDAIALRIAPADGSAPSTIIRRGAPMYWAWTNGDRLLVHSGEGPGGFLGEIGGDGAAAQPFATEHGGFRAPALSHDERYRAFVIPDAGADGGFETPGTGPTAHVVVESMNGSSHTDVPVFGGAALGFGPRSDALAFIAPAKPGRAVTLPVGPLRVVDAASGAVRNALAGSVVAFFWSPDGATIAALQIVEPGDDKIASARSVTPVASAPGLTLRLVFVDAASGGIRSQSVVRVGDLFTTQVLPYFDQYALSHRVWAADGSAIALPVVADDRSTGLLVIRADGSDARRVAAGVVGFWSP
jgi:TolB protein